MHVITYLPNFAPPHFAAHGIPKNTPHGTMEGHIAYIYMLSVYPFRVELSSFSLYKMHMLLHGLIIFVKYEKGSDKRNSLPACTLVRRECTNQLTYQVSFEGQLPVSVCCRRGMICQVI